MTYSNRHGQIKTCKTSDPDGACRACRDGHRGAVPYSAHQAGSRASLESSVIARRDRVDHAEVSSQIRHDRRVLVD